MDAYECIRAHIPPNERRGLVLIDPPFEKKNEFETLARQMRQWKKRWETGVFMLWYPIKAHLAVAALRERPGTSRSGGPGRGNTHLPRDRPETLNGCGVIIFNAPYSVPERVEAVLPILKGSMSLYGTACGWEVLGS